MSDAGLLTVKARFNGGALHDIRVGLTRPAVTRLFIGQAPQVVTKTVPYLFTLCAHAQRAAASNALAVASDEAPMVSDSAQLWIEMLHENFWRLLLDWPPALGFRPEKEAFVAWRNARQGDGALQASEDLLCHSIRPMAEKCLEMLIDRSTEEAAPGSDDHHTLAPVVLAPEAWLAYWQGSALQMPATAKPVSIRSAFQSRLAATESAVAALAGGVPFPVAKAGGDGRGVGQALTARGVLTHAVHLVDGMVANYSVQAPTDNLFADAAALSSLLATLKCGSFDQAKRLLNQAILALDPCVPYVVECQNA
jgi:hypothetical protein